MWWVAAAMAQVVVATTDLLPGETIGPEDVRPADLAAYGDSFSYVDEVVGRVPRERLLAGEPVRGERLSRDQESIGFGAVVPRGMRAVRLPVTGLRWVRAGDYVSLYAIRGDVAELVDEALGVGRVHDDGLTVFVLWEKGLTHFQEESTFVAALWNPVDVTWIETHGVAESIAGGSGLWLANKDLYPGIPIEAGDLVEVDPSAAIPSGWLSRDQVVGRVPRERILALEGIRPERLAGKAPSAATLPRRTRMVALQVTDRPAGEGPFDVVGTEQVEEVHVLGADGATLAVWVRPDDLEQMLALAARGPVELR